MGGLLTGAKLSPAPVSAGAGKRRAGNAFVEASLVLVPLFALIFAIVDFGLAIFVRTTLQHATREGVRYAVTYQTFSGMGHDASIKRVVQNAALGLLNGQAGLDKIHIRYYDPITFQEVPSNAPGNLVEVSVEDFRWGWIAPLLRSASPITFAARSSDRMEGLPGGQSPPPR
jgi:hypothetical protein